MSFYVGAIGTDSCKEKLSVISNNLANVNNTGFRPKSAIFSESINYNLNDPSEAVAELQVGTGIRVQRASTGFNVGGLTQTGSQYNYAITQANAFFMIRDPETEERVFTRNGHFHRGEWDEGFYFMTESGKSVLGQNQEPTKLDVPNIEKIREGMESGYGLEDKDEDEDEDEDKPEVSLYTFTNPNRLVSTGDNEFLTDNTEMEPVLVERPSLAEGALETSGMDVAREWTRLIECQRVFSYALRMATVSDEIEGTINTLRG